MVIVAGLVPEGVHQLLPDQLLQVCQVRFDVERTMPFFWISWRSGESQYLR